MGYGITDLLKDIATGGAYSATRATTEAVVGAVTGAQAGHAGGPVGQAGAGGAGAPGGAAGTAGGPAYGTISGTVSGTLSGTVAGTAGSAAYGAGGRCCCYAIEGEYLLNSETGQVWLIDAKQRQLLPFTRHMLPLESIAAAAGLDGMKQFLLEEKDSEIASMPHTARSDFANRVDTMVKVLDRDIAENMKAAVKRPA